MRVAYRDAVSMGQPEGSYGNTRPAVDTLGAGERALLERTATGAPLRDLLSGIVRLVESQATGMVCSILLLEGERLRHGAAPGLPATYTAAIDGASIGPRAGSCGTAAYRREPVIVEDIDAHPYWADYKQLILPHGFRACWSTPVLAADGSVLGTFAMYYPSTRGPTDLEREWVRAATHLAAVAIARDRSEQERRRLLHDLQERVKELTLVYGVAQLLQGDPPADATLLERIATMMPAAWRFPKAVRGACQDRRTGWRDGRLGTHRLPPFRALRGR